MPTVGVHSSHRSELASLPHERFVAADPPASFVDALTKREAFMPTQNVEGGEPPLVSIGEFTAMVRGLLDHLDPSSPAARSSHSVSSSCTKGGSKHAGEEHYICRFNLSLVKTSVRAGIRMHVQTIVSWFLPHSRSSLGHISGARRLPKCHKKFAGNFSCVKPKFPSTSQGVPSLPVVYLSPVLTYFLYPSNMPPQVKSKAQKAAAAQAGSKAG